MSNPSTEKGNRWQNLNYMVDMMKNKLFAWLAMVLCFVLSQAHIEKSETLTELFNALDAEAVKQEHEFDLKDILIQWVVDMKEEDLKVVFDNIRTHHGEKPPGKSDQGNQTCVTDHDKEEHHLRGRKHGHHHEDFMTDELIQEKFKKITSEESLVELRQLLEALNSKEGLVVLAEIGMSERDFTEVFKQITSGSGVAKAKKTLETLFHTAAGKNPPKLREIYKIFTRYQNKHSFVQLMKTSSVEELTNYLTILSKAEKRYAFKEIKFSELLVELKSEAGQASVVEKLTKWAEQTDDITIRRARQYCRMTSKGPRTVEQVKAIFIRKIDSKTEVQLLEFLEVLNTPKGKELMEKFHVMPSTPIAELISKLKGETQIPADQCLKCVKGVLKTWVQKLNLKDMQELQDARMLFVEYRARKDAMEEIERDDLDALLRIVTLLGKLQASGVRFVGIKLAEEKEKLEKNGEKSLQEVKKSMKAWVATLTLKQLNALRSDTEKARTQTIKPQADEPIKSTSPAKSPNPSTQSSGATAVKPTTTVFKLAEVRTAALFIKFALSKETDVQRATTPQNIRTAVSQVCQFGSTDDIKDIFEITMAGHKNHKHTAETAHFKGNLQKVESDLKHTKEEKEWISVRGKLKKWVEGWTNDQSSLFLTWFRIGAIHKHGN